MRYKHPAATGDGFFYACDWCENDECGLVVVWHKLPGRKGHFAICRSCIRKLYLEFVADEDKRGESIVVKRQIISETIRNSVFEGDNYRCVECEATVDLQIDHIIPFSRGGSSDIDNLQTLCGRCNRQKRDKL